MISDQIVVKFKKACKEGSLQEVRNILDTYPSLIHDERCKRAGLDAALGNVDRLVVDHLVSKFTQHYGQRYFFICDINDANLLHGFAKFGDDSLLLQALDAGVPVNTTTAINKWTPLHFSSSNSHASTGKLLIEYGANVNAQDRHLKSPLIHARDIGTIDLLIQAGADVNAADDSGNTPLMNRAMDGNPSACQLLINAGENLNAENMSGNTALHAASNEETVRVLLLSGADIEARNSHGYTPLHIYTKNLIDSCIEFAITKGADVKSRNNTNSSILHAASNVKIINALILAGADVHAKDDDGYTPLHLRAMNGNPLACEVLIDAGAEINVIAKDGGTPLICACSSEGDISTVIVLLEAGADPSLADTDNDSIVSIAEKNPAVHAALNAFQAKQAMKDAVARRRPKIQPPGLVKRTRPK